MFLVKIVISFVDEWTRFFCLSSLHRERENVYKERGRGEAGRQGERERRVKRKRRREAETKSGKEKAGERRGGGGSIRLFYVIIYTPRGTSPILQ